MFLSKKTYWKSMKIGYGKKSLVLIPHSIEVWKTQNTTAASND
jgi:hypothetical protein